MNIDNHPAPRPIAFDLEARGLGVVAGFAGSTGSLLALHYAALETHRSQRVLTVVTSLSAPVPVYTTLGAIPEKSQVQATQDAAKVILNDARRYLQNYPGKVVYRSGQGDAATVLANLSQFAELLVIGASGRGKFLSRVLGSVASSLPAHAHCPTIVVPREYSVTIAEAGDRFTPQQDLRPVIVGVDGSVHSRVAVLHAAQAAQDRGAPLHLLMTVPSLEDWLDWYPEPDPTSHHTTDHHTIDHHAPGQGPISRRQSGVEAFLDAEAAWVTRHFPALVVTASVKPGDPVAQLSTSTHEAQLTVLGTRGRGGFTGALLGSVSRGVLLQATGPVMIVPHLTDDRLEDHPGHPRKVPT